LTSGVTHHQSTTLRSGLWTMIDDHVTTMRFATRAELLVPFDRQTRLGEDVFPDVL